MMHFPVYSLLMFKSSCTERTANGQSRTETRAEAEDWKEASPQQSDGENSILFTDSNLNESVTKENFWVRCSKRIQMESISLHNILCICISLHMYCIFLLRKPIHAILQSPPARSDVEVEVTWMKKRKRRRNAELHILLSKKGLKCRH